MLCVRTALAAGRGWEVQLDAGGRYARGCSAPLGNLRGSLRGQRPPSLSSDSTVFTLPRRCAVVHGGFCFFVAWSGDKYVSRVGRLLQVIRESSRCFSACSAASEVLKSHTGRLTSLSTERRKTHSAKVWVKIAGKTGWWSVSSMFVFGNGRQSRRNKADSRVDVRASDTLVSELPVVNEYECGDSVLVDNSPVTSELAVQCYSPSHPPTLPSPTRRPNRSIPRTCRSRAPVLFVWRLSLSNMITSWRCSCRKETTQNRENNGKDIYADLKSTGKWNARIRRLLWRHCFLTSDGARFYREVELSIWFFHSIIPGPIRRALPRLSNLSLVILEHWWSVTNSVRFFFRIRKDTLGGVLREKKNEWSSVKQEYQQMTMFVSCWSANALMVIDRSAEIRAWTIIFSRNYAESLDGNKDSWNARLNEGAFERAFVRLGVNIFEYFRTSIVRRINSITGVLCAREKLWSDLFLGTG